MQNCLVLKGDFSTERIGSPDGEKNIPLMVKLNLLAKSKNLKNNEDYGMVSIAPVRSREQREEHSKLVRQLKQKRVENPNKQYHIRNETTYMVN